MNHACGCCGDPYWLWPGGVRACVRCDLMARWPSLVEAQERIEKEAQK